MSTQNTELILVLFICIITVNLLLPTSVLAACYLKIKNPEKYNSAQTLYFLWLTWFRMLPRLIQREEFAVTSVMCALGTEGILWHVGHTCACPGPCLPMCVPVWVHACPHVCPSRSMPAHTCACPGLFLCYPIWYPLASKLWVFKFKWIKICQQKFISSSTLATFCVQFQVTTSTKRALNWTV